VQTRCFLDLEVLVLRTIGGCLPETPGRKAVREVDEKAGSGHLVLWIKSLTGCTLLGKYLTTQSSASSSGDKDRSVPPKQSYLECCLGPRDLDLPEPSILTPCLFFTDFRDGSI
jgi:hypothetical protein